MVLVCNALFGSNGVPSALCPRRCAFEAVFHFVQGWVEIILWFSLGILEEEWQVLSW